MKELLTKKMDFWNTNAPKWVDHAQFGEHRLVLIDIARKAIRAAAPNLPKGSAVVDLGRGAGNCAYFHNLVETEPISVDFSAAMLSHGARGNEIQADIASPLPLAPASTDLCTSFYVMRYLSLEQHLDLLTEMHRILKPGGTFAFVDLDHNDYPHQESRFDAEGLGDIARRIGFNVIQAKMIAVRNGWITTGFGGSESKTFTYGVLIGQKKY